METQEFRVPKDKIKVNDLKVFPSRDAEDYKIKRDKSGNMSRDSKVFYPKLHQARGYSKDWESVLPIYTRKRRGSYINISEEHSSTVSNMEISPQNARDREIL